VVFACYLACFSLSYGPVCWIIVAEIFPTAIRGRAMSISIFSLWTGCNLVALTFPAALASYGASWTFWLFGLTTPLAILYVILRVPETKGKSLEEIEKQFIR
jgi:MFS transporter, SP family, arabinose:H+ symporter